MIVTRVKSNYDPKAEEIYTQALKEILPGNCKVTVNSYLIESGDEVDTIFNIDVLLEGQFYYSSVDSLQEAKKWAINTF